MKKLLVIVACLICAVVQAQTDSLLAVSPSAGQVIINQDPRIESLINTHIAINKANTGKTSGWRIQIYNSSGSNSRAQAQSVRSSFLAKYPNVGAYLIYQPPFFKIRVGDFRTKAEAYAFYKQLLSDFPVSYLITDKINYPKLLDKPADIPNNLGELMNDIH